MTSPTPVQIGFIGFGTVLGEGASKLLAGHSQQHAFSIKYIVVRNVARYQEKYPDIDPNVFITDLDVMLQDEDVKIVVEATGGVDQPAQFIKKALKAKKHVVSANKDAVATHTSSLFFMAASNGVHIRFEGAVAGGVDVLDTLMALSEKSQIGAFAGILNGTSNYILTQMDQQNLSFQEALHMAQEKGFAESNPDNDVKGKDAGYKLALLASLAYGIDIEPYQLWLKGIDEISPQDMALAKSAGYTIKLIAQAVPSQHEEGYWMLVQPTWISKEQAFYTVDNEYNLITMDVDGQPVQFGPKPGAGAVPTGESVVKDIQLVQTQGMERELLPAVVLEKESFVGDWVVCLPQTQSLPEHINGNCIAKTHTHNAYHVSNCSYGDILTMGDVSVFPLLTT